jgi:2-methylcitrate dehydratase PrpD
MDLAKEFADVAAQVRHETLPAETVRCTKLFLLDTLAVGLAGATADGIAGGLAYSRELGGTPCATVLASGDRLPAPTAAMLNGTLCQARDFDPVYEPGVLLPYAPVTAAALAVGEATGANGSDVLTAIVLGADLSCRLGRSLTSGLGWSRTGTLGVFGAALAAAYLLHLSREQTVWALGLALSQSSGNIQTVIDGSLAKRYQAGFAAEAGLRAAMLARNGVTGPVNVFEGRCGFMQLYEGGRFERARATDGLGSVFEGTRASIKPYPCAREQHGAIAAALELAGKGITAERVERVEVTLPPNAHVLSGRAFGRDGATIAGAMGAAAYGAAVALTRGAVGLGDFTPEALHREEVMSLVERVTVTEDAAERDRRALVPQTVSVLLRGGEQRSATCSTMPGSPDRPLDPSAHRLKVIDCLTTANPTCVGALAERADALAQVVDRLDDDAGLPALIAYVAHGWAHEDAATRRPSLSPTVGRRS